MNIQLSAKTFTSTAALLADHAAVRRRLFAPTKERKANEPQEQELVATVRRHHPREKLRFQDAHVAAYRRWQMIAANGPCTAHILKRCEEERYSYEVVTGPNRKRDVTHFRQMLMWEIKTTVKPSISLPELGRLFGGRDHTTALHGVRAHQARVENGEA